ncbi:MAG: YARHG domain-containing protein [Clostridiaceae bacterium]|nr:YARHG domain-containing protein [Clostridiaceae bacterium]
MNYKVCRKCNRKCDYGDSRCKGCGADITIPDYYDLISVAEGQTIYRLWSESMSKFLALVLTLVVSILIGIVSFSYLNHEGYIETGYQFDTTYTGDNGSGEDTDETSANSNQNGSTDSQSTKKSSSSSTKKSSSSSTQKSKASDVKTIKSCVLPKSNQKVYSMKTLNKLSSTKLAIARNEIYARRGYIFDTESWKEYFSKKKWYKGKYSSSYFNAHANEIFNKYEKKNIKRIQKIEKQREG